MSKLFFFFKKIHLCSQAYIREAKAYLAGRDLGHTNSVQCYSWLFLSTQLRSDPDRPHPVMGITVVSNVTLTRHITLVLSPALVNSSFFFNSSFYSFCLSIDFEVIPRTTQAYTWLWAQGSFLQVQYARGWTQVSHIQTYVLPDVLSNAMNL